MSEHEAQTSHEEHFQEDKPLTGLLFTELFVLSGLLIAVILAVAQFFVMATRHEIQTKQLLPVDARLAETRTKSNDLLNNYGKNESGTYRIPVAHAIDLVLANQALLNASAPEPAPVATEEAPQ